MRLNIGRLEWRKPNIDKLKWRRRWIRFKRRHLTGRNKSTALMAVGVAAVWHGLGPWPPNIATCFVGVAFIVYGLFIYDVDGR